MRNLIESGALIAFALIAVQAGGLIALLNVGRIAAWRSRRKEKRG